MRSLKPLCAVVLLSLLAAVGCDKKTHDVPGPPERTSCVCDTAPVVDPVLLSFLSKARAAHHNADISLQAGDRAAAIRALELIVEGPAPPGSLPEVAEVTADTHARLAELRSEEGDFDAAAKDVDAGLALAKSPSHFQGHLFEVRGIVEERRAKALEDAGQHQLAAQARQKAVTAFDKAIEVQDNVITDALNKARDNPQ